MKFTIIVAVAILSVTSVFAQPKLEIVGGDTYSWGKVKPTSVPLKTKIKLKNSGNQTLTVSDVKVGCGCTGTILDNKTIEPGKTSTLEVSLNIQGINGETTKTITIASNDAKAPTKVLKLHANVLDPFKMSQSYILLSDLKVGKESTGEITMENNSGKDIKITDVSITNGAIVTNVNKKTVIKNGQKFKLQAKATPNKAGYFTSTISMTTTYPEKKKIDLMVYGQAK